MKRSRQEDRLSALPDETLRRILSHLRSEMAVRTSVLSRVLSRRWHHVYTGVPVVNLLDPKTGTKKSKIKVCFDQQVTGAILCKAPRTPIRTFWLDTFNPPRDLLDQWIITAVSSGVEEMDVKLRYWDSSSKRRLCPFGSSKEALVDFDKYEWKSYVKTQHHLFDCPTLRRLRLKNWTLDLPLGAVMSSLETLCLARIMDPKDQLQQLLPNCPRLTDLTLQECPSLRKITVTSAHLRKFAMICCHHARRVKLSSSCLQSLHYKGALPCKSLFKLANHAGVVALKIEICEDLSEKKATEFAPATKLIRRCTELAYLHLSLHPSMSCCSSLFTDAVPCLQRLRQLSLQCCLHNEQDVRSVAVLLCDTHNLEVLSLYPLGPETPNDSSYCSDSELDTEPEDDGDDYSSWVADGFLPMHTRYTEPEDDGDYGVDYISQVTDSFWPMHIRCLDDKLRRINIRDYRGLQLEKILAKFLLSKAAALEEFSVTLMDGYSRNKRKIAKELRSWRQNKHTRVTVNRW